jgi:hypothetical protein
MPTKLITWAAEMAIKYHKDIGWAFNQAFGPGKPSVEPQKDGNWYLALYYDHRQRSRMSRTCTVGPYGDKAQRTAQRATRHLKFTLINVKPEHAVAVSFKLNGDKGGPFQWRRDRARTAHFRPNGTYYLDGEEKWRHHQIHESHVALRPGTKDDRGCYVCDIRGIERKRFIELNPGAAVMIEIFPPRPLPRLGHP